MFVAREVGTFVISIAARRILNNRRQPGVVEMAIAGSLAVPRALAATSQPPGPASGYPSPG
jgi:hypothetical protein